MFNVICLIGRLTRDPEIRYLKNGNGVATFGLAVDRYGEGTDFFNVVTWNKTAEFAAAYLKKGNMIALRGSVHFREYVDKEGQNRKTTEVKADEIKSLEKKPKEQTFTEVVESADDDFPF